MSTQINLGMPIPVSNLPSFADESTQLWSKAWVAVGVEEMITEPGEVIPATIGDHGIHVLRHSDGHIDAGYNAFQQGSCWTVPVQCGNGAKIDCPYVSCGHSRDGGVLTPTDVSHQRLIRQVVGARPDKRALLPFAKVGPILFAAMPMNQRQLLNEQFSNCFERIENIKNKVSFQGHIRLEITTNWRYAGAALKKTIQARFGPRVDVVSGPPNLTVVVADTWMAILTIKPVNFSRSELLVATYGKYGTAVDWNEFAGQAGHVTGVDMNPIATWAESFFTDR